MENDLCLLLLSHPVLFKLKLKTFLGSANFKRKNFLTREIRLSQCLPRHKSTQAFVIKLSVGFDDLQRLPL